MAVGFGVIPALILLDTAVALLQGYRPQGKTDVALAVCCGLVLLALLLLLPPRRGRALLARFGGRLVLLAWSCALSLALLESILHLTVTRPAFHHRQPNLTMTIPAAPEVWPGTSGEAVVTYNRLGLRGPDLPDQRDGVRILCLGGSTTECGNLDDAEVWSQLLMDRLHGQGARVWVGNVGRSGYATHHHLQFIERSDLLDAVDVVVVQAGINDLWRALSGWDRRSDLDLLPKPLWFRTRLLREYRAWRGRMMEQAEHALQTEGADGYTLRRRRRQQAAIVEAAPDLTAALDGYRRRVESMVRRGRARGVEVVFTTQPVLWRADLEPRERKLLWFGWLPNGDFLSVERLRSVMDDYNDVLRRTCADLGAGLIDLEAMNGRPELFSDDCHFSESGARDVATRVAEWFISSHPAFSAADREHGGTGEQH